MSFQTEKTETYKGEWLTTGEMIDRLKVGEVAECQTGEKVKIFEKSNLPYFQGIEKAICWILEDGDSLPFYMSEGNRRSRWRILPNYVSFDEAKTALEEGKKVKFQTSNGHWLEIENDTRIKGFSFDDFFSANWIIEDD